MGVYLEAVCIRVEDSGGAPGRPRRQRQRGPYPLPPRSNMRYRDDDGDYVLSAVALQRAATLVRERVAPDGVRSRTCEAHGQKNCQSASPPLHHKTE